MFLKIADLAMLGDSAVLVRFKQRINADINSQVLALQDAIESAQVRGVTFLSPAYCSLTVGFDPLIIERRGLCRRIETLANQIEPSSRRTGRRMSIPVCYDEEFGLDLAEVASQTRLSAEEIVALHTSATYRVFMLGFLPGFAYLGKTPKPLKCARKSSARLRVAARSVALAGRQTAIYPSEAPGGWQIIGRTPVRPFDPHRTDSFLMRPGDEVTFQAISKEELLELERDDGQADGDLVRQV